MSGDRASSVGLPHKEEMRWVEMRPQRPVGYIRKGSVPRLESSWQPLKALWGAAVRCVLGGGPSDSEVGFGSEGGQDWGPWHCSGDLGRGVWGRQGPGPGESGLERYRGDGGRDP